MTLKHSLVFLKEYSIISLGIIMYALGWTIFLVPNNLIGGGVTGISSIVQYATNGVIKVGYTYFVLNAILLVLALFFLGRNSSGKTLYAIILASVCLNLFQAVIPEQIFRILAIDNGKLMSTIMGALMVGTGMGMAFSQGGSTGGTDIIALIVNKYHNISPGRMILMMDCVIILSSLLVPSYTKAGDLVPFPEKVTTVVYGFILIGIITTVLDMYIAGTRQSVQLFILSKKYDQIADIVTNEFHRGVTVLDGKGWYTKEPAQVVMVITRKTDLNVMLRRIKSIDPDAFLSVSYVSGVYGKGFDTIKK